MTLPTKRGYSEITIKGVGSAVAEASNYFGINLYRLLAKEKNNVFFSPFSISTALAMVFCGAENETAEEMRKVLGYDAANIKDEELKSSFQKLLNALDSNPESYTFNCANAVLSHKRFSVKKKYKALLEDFFKALFQEVDFTVECKAVQLVNEFVKEKTNGKIPEVLESVVPFTEMMILNAVYFKGRWLDPFHEIFTCQKNFYNKGDKNNCKEVDMMHKFGCFLCVEKESYKALELSYKGNDISMLILLPNSKDGLSELENSLSITFIQDLTHDLKEHMWKGRVSLDLPKFRLDYSKSLKDSLQSMGLNRVFKLDAQLNGINDDSPEPLFLYAVDHTAVLEVNETGCEAAAVTRPEMNGGGPVESIDFKVDHPFMFVIYNTKNNLILFIGRVEEL